jgi:hypothetical protein
VIEIAVAVGTLGAVFAALWGPWLRTGDGGFAERLERSADLEGALVAPPDVHSPDLEPALGPAPRVLVEQQ